MKRPSSAVPISLVLHGALLALVLHFRYDTGPPSAANIVYAELVRVEAAQPSSEASEPTPQADEPPAALQAETPAATDETAPPAAAQTPEPEPAPDAPSAAPDELDQPPASIRADAPSEPDEAERQVAPAAPSPAVATAATDEPPPTPLADAAEPTRVAVPAAQQAMIAGRFTSWTTSQNPGELPDNAVWKHDGRQYEAVFRPLPAESSTGIDRLIVEVRTEQDGKRMATQLQMKRLAFSSFAQLVDRWDPDVQIHDDEIDGRFHSNSEINVLSNREARPIFHGRVTTASRNIRTDSAGRLERRQMFLAGLETGVRKIVLPQQFVPFPQGEPEGEHVRRFAEDARVTFRADGTYAFAAIDSSAAETIGSIGDGPHFLIGQRDAALHVKGVVKGKVLVYSPREIVIEGDLTYAEHPNVSSATEDYLGLVSDRSVVVAEPAVTGPGDLVIHASIFAKRRFVVRSYRSRPSGTLFIFGSLSAGSVSATEPRFATKMKFDDRLENMRAPGFPQTDRYELESWDGAWRAAAPQ
jgi:hypothetical protein